MRPDTVVTWKWKSAPGYRSTFGPETVNTLKRMVKRHYAHPHRFVCVTDDAAGIDADVEIVPDAKDFASLPSPTGGHNPSCYRRLRMYAPEAGRVFGSERFVSLDLDIVMTGDLDPVWNRPEDFVIWGETNPRSFYNGSMFMLTAGARPQLWADFNPRTSPTLAKRAGRFGSDQGWISYKLGKGEATWTREDGVYSFRVHLEPKNGGEDLPANARVVHFHGKCDPWHWRAQRLAWVREHWGAAA